MISCLNFESPDLIIKQFCLQISPPEYGQIFFDVRRKILESAKHDSRRRIVIPQVCETMVKLGLVYSSCKSQLYFARPPCRSQADTM